MIIVIDGPSGSGKSSTAKAVAESLGIQYLDSGALYRAITWIWLEEDRPETFLEILSARQIRFEYRNGQFRIWVNGSDISLDIRKQRVSEQVSTVAAMPEVREFVNLLMRNAVKEGDYIADGRDLGTAVFPDAALKFFMKASLDVRAKRRYSELLAGGDNVAFQDVKANLSYRDKADSTRNIDPLVQPEDAYVIDTTEKSFDEQVKEICTVINKKFRFK